MILRPLLFAAILWGAAPQITAAQTASPAISETEIESRAKKIGRALRCVVCQNQSIEESDASLAEDMRRLVRAKVRAGNNEAEVIDFMQERYGDFVLLKPPVQRNTYALWAAPFLAVLAGLFWFLRQNKTRKPAPRLQGLSREEETRLNDLLDK